MKPVLTVLTIATVAVVMGCAPITPVYPTTTPVPVVPSPTLEAAQNFTIGVSNIPESKYLFIELYEYDTCSDACHCPVVEPPMWAYEWDSGELCFTNDEYYYQSFPVSVTTPSPPLLGLYAGGRWHELLMPITTLPFEESYLPIYSVDTDGSIVIGLQGSGYFLRPGQSWTEAGTYKREPPEGCTKYYETRLINHGLINREQIKACE